MVPSVIKGDMAGILIELCRVNEPFSPNMKNCYLKRGLGVLYTSIETHIVF